MRSGLPIDISVIIPAKDEAKRLPAFLENLILYCQNSIKQYEIIVVDDGSNDRTSEVAGAYRKRFSRLKVIRLHKNKGKGYAVRTGLMNAEGDVALFLDADGSTPADEIEKNLHYFDQGYDIVIGSRVVSDDRHLVTAKYYRKLIGQVFNLIVQTVLFQDIKDSQCGFKMFRKDTVRPIFSRMNIPGFGFDLEALFVARQLGYKIKEVPVNWHHVDESKIDIFRDSLTMLRNIFQIRLWHGVPINRKHQHMSPQEIATMARVEQRHWWFRSKNNLVHRLIQRTSRRFENILDAGCGTGLNLTFLRNFGLCYGCDAVPEALEYCREMGIHNLARCDLENICFKGAQFDLITMLDVLEHVQSPEEALSEVKRVLRDDGMVVLTVPAFKSLWSHHDEALSHLRRYHRKELIALLEESGFSVERSGYFFFTSFLPVAGIRILKKVFFSRKSATCDTTDLPPPWLNRLWIKVFDWESRLFTKFQLPWGTTLYAVMRPRNELKSIDGIKCSEHLSDAQDEGQEELEYERNVL